MFVFLFIFYKLQEQMERFKTVINLIEASEIYQNEKLVFAEGRKRQYWNDDLRKGSFQFIQACGELISSSFCF